VHTAGKLRVDLRGRSGGLAGDQTEERATVAGTGTVGVAGRSGAETRAADVGTGKLLYLG
jgi:hypothetical protein